MGGRMLPAEMIRAIQKVTSKYAQEAPDPIWPEVLCRPRLHAVADFVLNTAGIEEYAQGHQAALHVVNHLARCRPSEVTDEVRQAMSLGSGVSAVDVDNTPSYFTFCPRPDNTEDMDQQTSFAESQTDGISFVLGGNGSGCLGAEQPVYDPVAGVARPVSQIDGPFHVWARDKDGRRVIAQAEQPRVYGVEDLYEVTLSNGQTFISTLEHRVFGAGHKWVHLSNAIADEDGTVPALCRSAECECGEIVSLWVVSHRYLRRDVYWDFHVPEHENYELSGIWHHNTTTCALAKLVRFLLETPAPRRDAPSWVIAGSYEQVMSLYDEKLDQKGHLPPYVIDKPRIAWYRSNSNWPYRVPLKPDKHGNNHVIEFKSYEQGRQQMQARSITSFCFIEQFPWDLLTEVLRGCREYSFSGNKVAEFTPIDPTMSATLEEMVRFGKAPAIRSDRIRGAHYMPNNWDVFYCNTSVAAEAGHVSKEWFDEFSAMIPDDMLDVRLRGMFASFEGLIYKGLNPSIHFVDDDVWQSIPDDAIHMRGIDWGQGQENPFCCLWGLRDRRSPIWWIYDEYYSSEQTKTVIDHLVDVFRRHPWRPGHQFYGPTFADPSGIGNIRIAQKLTQYVDESEGVEPISISMAANAVDEGIEHVKYLLKPSRPVIDPEDPRRVIQAPRLFIHEANCPNLCRELRSYRYEKSSGTGVNPRDAKPVPLKKADHACDSLRYLTFSFDRMQGCNIESASHHSAANELVRRDSKRTWRKTLRR